MLTDVISLYATRKCQKIENVFKIVYIHEENIHIFQTTWGISVKFCNYRNTREKKYVTWRAFFKFFYFIYESFNLCNVKYFQ